MISTGVVFLYEYQNHLIYLIKTESFVVAFATKLVISKNGLVPIKKEAVK